jgi:hypothetical protein
MYCNLDYTFQLSFISLFIFYFMQWSTFILHMNMRAFWYMAPWEPEISYSTHILSKVVHNS